MASSALISSASSATVSSAMATWVAATASSETEAAIRQSRLGLVLALRAAPQGVDQLVRPELGPAAERAGLRLRESPGRSARGRSAPGPGPSAPWSAGRRLRGSSGPAHPPRSCGRGAGGRIRWPAGDRYRRATRTPWRTAPEGGDAAAAEIGETRSDWTRPMMPPFYAWVVQFPNVRCLGGTAAGSARIVPMARVRPAPRATL